MEKRLALVVGYRGTRRIIANHIRDSFDIIEADIYDAAVKARELNDSLTLIFVGVTISYVEAAGFIELMNKYEIVNRVPIFVYAQHYDPKAAELFYGLRVAEYITLPFDPKICRLKARNVLEMYRKKDEFEDKTVEFARETADNQDKTIDFLANVIEARNLENGAHVTRVKEYTRVLAKQVMEDWPEFGLDEETCELYASASALHDIGKIMIRESVLLKPSRLNDEETEYMKSHTVTGSALLRKMKTMLNEEFYLVSYDICRHHHERFDGKGYPDGLKGDEIPLSAQIASVADCYDALTAKRPYKDAFPGEKAYEMILNGECGVFNEKIIESFKRCYPAFASFT